MTQTNQKGLSSQNIDTKSLKTQLTKAKLPEPVFSCVPTEPLLVLTKVIHSARGDAWADPAGKAHLLLPTQLL